MEMHYNQSDMLHDALQAFKAIETRVEKATEKYDGVQSDSKGLKKYKKILETSAAQLKVLETMGYSNIAQYHKISSMLVSANFALERALDRKHGRTSHCQKMKKSIARTSSQ
jgi:hypothetical protein